MRTCYLTITVMAFSCTTISAVDAQSPPNVPYDASIMSGFPPAQDKRITLKNWQTQPFNHWAFLHMEQVMRTALVDRGVGPIARLEKSPRSLASLKFKSPKGEAISVAEARVQIDCNGYLLIKDGEIVFKYYAHGFGPRRRHLTQSAGKSVAAWVPIFRSS